MKFKLVFLFIALIFALLPQSSFVFAESEITNIKVVAENVKIYDSENIESNVIKVAEFGEEFSVTSESEKFYYISFNEQNGYILKAYCQNSNSMPIKKYLDTNAVITKNSNVYFYVENEYQMQNIVLSENTRIKLLSGADNNQEFSKVTFNYEDKTLTGYIQTDNINADGIPTKTIIAIFLIVACVCIFLILYGIYNSAKKKNKLQKK